jgi:signal transduction histidine kinase
MIDWLSLRARLALLPLIVGVVVAVILIFSYYTLTRDARLQEIGRGLADQATVSANSLDYLLRTAIRVVKTLANDAALGEAIAIDRDGFTTLSDDERSSRLRALNARWMRTTDEASPFIQGYLNNAAAQRLKQHQDQFPGVYGELFVTDRSGALVGATGRLTTLAHGHKPWWQAAYADGRGMIFLDDRGFDESVGEPVLGIVAPVTRNGEVIGILKANMLLRGLFATVVTQGAANNRTEKALVRSAGSVLMEPGAELLSTSLPEYEIERMAARTDFVDIAKGPAHSLVQAFAPIPLTLGTEAIGFGGSEASVGHRLGNRGDYWGVLVTRNVGIAGVLGLPLWLLVVGTTSVLLLIAVASGYLGHRLAQPIRTVASKMTRYRRDAVVPRLDDRGPPEVRELSKAFHDMAERIAQQTASIEALNAEVARREAAEERAVKAHAELRQAFEKSLQLEKLSALGTFIGGIAHEINNPLMGLSNFISYVEAKTPDPKHAEILGRAQAQVQRIKRIVERVQGYSAKQAAETGPIDIEKVISDAGLLVKPQLDLFGITLDVQIPKPPPVVVNNKDILDQVLVNLLLNAIHAVSNQPRREIRIDVKTVPTGATITVEDSGPGVPESLSRSIFNPFFTTKQPGQGTGLGLSVSLRELSEIGGSLSLDQSYSGGARFVVLLPDKHRAAVSNGEPAPER